MPILNSAYLYNFKQGACWPKARTQLVLEIPFVHDGCMYVCVCMCVCACVCVSLPLRGFM